MRSRLNSRSPFAVWGQHGLRSGSLKSERGTAVPSETGLSCLSSSGFKQLFQALLSRTLHKRLAFKCVRLFRIVINHSRLKKSIKVTCGCILFGRGFVVSLFLHRITHNPVLYLLAKRGLMKALRQANKHTLYKGMLALLNQGQNSMYFIRSISYL